MKGVHMQILSSTYIYLKRAVLPSSIQSWLGLDSPTPTHGSIHHPYFFLLSLLPISNADDPYRFYSWTITYGTIYPLCAPQQGIIINGQFPGPTLDVVTNDNIILDVVNQLDQPFLLTWNGIQQRKNSWEDGVLGTNCPIPPSTNFTYKFQTKDQIKPNSKLCKTKPTRFLPLWKHPDHENIHFCQFCACHQWQATLCSQAQTFADYFNIPGVLTWDGLSFQPAGSGVRFGTTAVRLNFHDFIEIVFVNMKNTIQTWYLDGYKFWVVGYGSGSWTSDDRANYNLIDAIARYTVQVYPSVWSAIMVSLDNEGMWNLRSAMWVRQYLGRQLYLRVWSSQQSLLMSTTSLQMLSDAAGPSIMANS